MKRKKILFASRTDWTFFNRSIEVTSLVIVNAADGSVGAQNPVSSIKKLLYCHRNASAFKSALTEIKRIHVPCSQPLDSSPNRSCRVFHNFWFCFVRKSPIYLGTNTMMYEVLASNCHPIDESSFHMLPTFMLEHPLNKILFCFGLDLEI